VLSEVGSVRDTVCYALIPNTVEFIPTLGSADASGTSPPAQVTGFRVYDLGFGVEGRGLMVQGLGFGV
jgi:hypothetical protein